MRQGRRLGVVFGGELDEVEVEVEVKARMGCWVILTGYFVGHYC